MAEDEESEDEEFLTVQETLARAIRQADVYKRLISVLDLHNTDEKVQNETIDVASIQRAWASKDKRYTINLDTHSAKALLESIGEGSEENATRKNAADFFHHMRYVKHIPYKEWQRSKSQVTATLENLKMEELRKGLSGEAFKLQADELEKLLQSFDILPESAYKGPCTILVPSTIAQLLHCTLLFLME